MVTGPTFLGIGAPKCGTTWLYAKLQAHPDVWLAPKKELHYFDRSAEYAGPTELSDTAVASRLLTAKGWRRHDVLRRLGKTGRALANGQTDDARFWWRMVFGTYDDRWYTRLFPQPGTYEAVGEITPAYCILSGSDVRKIRAINPDMRIVFLIRDPVERAWSSLRYNAGRGMVDLDLSDVSAIVQKIHDDASDVDGGRGDYLRTLDVFGDVFDPAQILVGYYDAIASQPAPLLEAVSDHIGIAAGKFPASENTRVNPSQARDMPPEVRDVLREKYRPQIEGVMSRIGGRAKSWLDDTPPIGPVAQVLG